jgi:hypothetical protein
VLRSSGVEAHIVILETDTGQLMTATPAMATPVVLIFPLLYATLKVRIVPCVHQKIEDKIDGPRGCGRQASLPTS